MDPVMLDRPETHPLSERVADALAFDPGARAVEFEGRWHSWADVGALAHRIASVASRFTSSGRPQVGVLLRNRPAHVATLLGVLMGGGCVVVVNPSRGHQRTRADIAALRLPMLIGEPDDLATLSAAHPHTASVSITTLDAEPTVTAAQHLIPEAEASRPGVAVRMLTSGTTGPPKRVDLTYDMLARSVFGAKHYESSVSTQLRVRRGIAVVNSPLVHIGGVFRVLQCVADARSFVLLERFDVDRWADAVRRYRPGAASLVPAALRMVLHADLPREDLQSIRAVVSGTAPLSPDDADAFTEKYGIPVLTSYAATEFGGGVAGWTLADYTRYWGVKRGSVGRAHPDSQLRVVDDHGNPLGPDQPGLLEVRPGQLGPSAGWIHTTDMARIDEDGFVWILGRADQAIIRGGFKVMPDDVRAALESHPAVEGAAVIGKRDERLGETPAAVVELVAGQSTDAGRLVEFLGSRLARYEIPTEIRIVDAIPRTASGKPDLSAIRVLFDHDG
jgi:acyl-CoA synthetase (AMP-forming)/AMP-acid ligase II